MTRFSILCLVLSLGAVPAPAKQPPPSAPGYSAPVPPLSLLQAVSAARYRQAHAATTFTVVQAASRLDLDATLQTSLGSPSDQASSAVAGTLSIDVTPAAAPFTGLHVSALDLVVTDDVGLRFGFGFLGSIRARADAESLAVALTQPGPPVPLTENAFLQDGNEGALAGTLNLEGSGGLSSLVPDAPQPVDFTGPLTLTGTLTQDGDTLRLEAVLRLEGSFEVEGNTVAFIVQGPLVATALLPLATPIEAPGVVPSAFALEQNYPNPFNPTTTIRYTLPTAAPVRLAVFDLLGREVAVLAEGARPAGHHAVTFDAAGLPSGLYLYRLQAGRHTTTRRLLLQ